MKEQLENYIRQAAEQKIQSYPNGALVKVIANGKIHPKINNETTPFSVNWKLVKRSGNSIHVEERQENRHAYYGENGLQISNTLDDEREKNELRNYPDFTYELEQHDERNPFFYDRQKAVQYAETWWNSFNPKYRKFKDDCTNFISQCIYAGGFPMKYTGKRNSGWWYKNGNWSYSWSVAHAFQLFLASSKYTRTMDRPDQLTYGDIICYDFEGDGRFNHNTIVTGKDDNGQPLVNAHTTNSRQRYWAYEDSSAYTPNIRYRFFHIVGGA